MQVLFLHPSGLFRRSASVEGLFQHPKSLPSFCQFQTEFNVNLQKSQNSEEIGAFYRTHSTNWHGIIGPVLG
jgi:hypothetical protein